MLSVVSGRRWNIIYFLSVFFSIASAVSITRLPITRRQTVVAAPIVIAASQDWDGSDGLWSSFTLQVGTPPQIVKVFPSTSGYQTIVVLNAGCATSDPENCADIRGHLFNQTESTSWANNTANSTTQIYNNNIGKSVGFASKAAFGFDDVTLGWPGAGGPTLKNQTVGGIASKDSYLGQFGLAPRASNFTSFSAPVPSYIENLKSTNLIPSKSWAYTAGNQYRHSKVLGSLILGGYDQSLYKPHNVTWRMNSQDIKDLTVQLENIETSTGSGSKKLLDAPVAAFLDSSVSWMYLPESACEHFEEAFGLRWHEQGEFYFLSDAEHQALKSLNPEVTFTIGNLTAGANVQITFPYSAFDLEIKNPYVSNPTRYFPLKRAESAEQYTLGRVFFQEAYVIADYERGTFTVSQCDWTPSPRTEIVAIMPVDTKATITTATIPEPVTPRDERETPVGAIVGGAAGGGVAILGLAFAYWFFRIRQRNTNGTLSHKSSNVSGDVPSDGGLTVFKPELDATQAPTPRTETNGQVELHEDDVYKAELFAGNDQRFAGNIYEKCSAPIMHEMEGGGNKWTIVEADGRQIEIHEMPATEEVAIEIDSDHSQDGLPGQLGAVRCSTEQRRGSSPISPSSQVSPLSPSV